MGVVPGRLAQPRERQSTGFAPDPRWYQDAIIYEVHVRAFQDSTGDGVGDFRGLTSRLDYLADLGVTAIWLLPFYPSPLRDDGYDIADYVNVHADYGSLRDVRAFIREAHRRDLRVITELVFNHTSDQHPWFRRARKAPPGSTERDWYVWSETPDPYPDARIIFKDFEASNWSWDPVAGAYFWHRFYGHQPDLNFDEPKVQEALLKVTDFWLEAACAWKSRRTTSPTLIPPAHRKADRIAASESASWLPWISSHSPGKTSAVQVSVAFRCWE